MRKVVLRTFLLLALFGTASANSVDLPVFCDRRAYESAKALDRDPETLYQVRGSSRCEGVFASPVAARPLQLVSVTTVVPPGAFASEDVWTLSWCRKEPGVTRIVARHLAEPAYRMDASVSTSQFNWPARVLSLLQINRRDLALLATSVLDVGGFNRRITWPVRLSDSSSTRYRFVVEMPERPLREFKITMNPVDHQEARTFALERRDLVPGKLALELDLQRAGLEEGIYVADLGAVDADGRPTTSRPFYLAHHPRGCSPE